MTQYACHDCDTTFNAPTDTETAGCPGCGEMAWLEPVVPVSSPPPDQTALRDRIRRVLCDHDGKDYLWGTDMLEPDEYGELADAVLAVLPPPADRAAVNAVQCLLLRAADLVAERASDLWAPGSKAHAEMLRDAAELRRLAAEAQQPGCPSCVAGIAHDVHCPTPETHNWGCGCPSDVTAAIASCPGYETKGPSPCRCPCYGCKHHCGTHDPSRLAAEAQQPDATPRPVQHAPGKAVLCSDCLAKGYAVCMDGKQQPVHKGGNADDCPACQTDGLDTIGPPYECPGSETAANGEEAGT